MELPTLIWPDVVLLPGESAPLCFRDLSNLPLNSNVPLHIGQVSRLQGDIIIGALISVRMLPQDEEDQDEPDLYGEVIGVFKMLSWRRGDEESFVIARVEMLSERETRYWSSRPYVGHHGDDHYAYAINQLHPKVNTPNHAFSNSH